MGWYNVINIGLLIILWTLIAMNFRSVAAARKFWLLYFFVYTLTEAIAIPISLRHQSNLWVYNVSKPIQFLLLILYFADILAPPVRIKALLLTAGALLSAAFLFTGSLI